MGVFKKVDCYLVELGTWIDYNSNNFKRHIYIPDVLSDKIIKERYKNIGVFKTAYSYDKFDINNSYLYGDYYIDFDHNDNFELVREDVLTTIQNIKTIFKIKEDNLKIFFSGNKGIHIIIDKDILGVMPNKKLNIIYKYITNFFKKQTKNKTIDTQIYDNKRLFRVENTIHEKTMLYKIPLTYNELTNLSHSKIKGLAKNRREYVRGQYDVNTHANEMYLKMEEFALNEHNQQLNKSYRNNTNELIRDTPKCISKLLEQGPISGQRNLTLAALTSFYKTKGYNYDDTVQMLLEWNSNALNDIEFYKTVKSIYRSNFKYGCNTFKEISECDYRNCPLMRGRIKNEQK